MRPQYLESRSNTTGRMVYGPEMSDSCGAMVNNNIVLADGVLDTPK